jgi:DNA-binding NarL/FixJ family response regulator
MATHLRLVPAAHEQELMNSHLAPIRLMLAESHRTMRRCLRALLDEHDDLVVVGEADHLASLELELQRQRTQVLLFDLGMHDGSGSLAALSRFSRRVPLTTIVALTMRDDPVLARHALLAGAVGFVSKDLADNELVAAVRAAAQGKQFVSRRVACRASFAENYGCRPTLPACKLPPHHQVPAVEMSMFDRAFDRQNGGAA